MSPPLRLQFVMSADGVGSLPDSRVEVAIVGRSNVGKSTLINAVANRKNLAQTSKTPGRTRLLNCYEVEERAAGPGAAIIDCPGYGYAAVSGQERAKWQRMIEEYLLDRPQLAMVLALVDGEIGPTKLDVQLLDWVQASALPHTVIATKADKVKSSGRQKRKQDLAQACGLDPGDVVWVSAAKSTGVDRVRDLLRGWLEI